MLARLPHRRIIVLDVLVIGWVLLCLTLGITVAKRINHLGALGDGLVSAGDSVSGVGDWISGLQDTPLIGGSIGSIADRVDALGASTAQQGRNGKDAVWRAALWIGILLTLLPTVPVLAVWIPVRVRQERERTSLRAALEANEPGVWEYLALQAVDDLSFHDLRQISADPWEDIRRGDYESLARIEIDRLGLTPPAGQQPVRPSDAADTAKESPPEV